MLLLTSFSLVDTLVADSERLLLPNKQNDAIPLATKSDYIKQSLSIRSDSATYSNAVKRNSSLMLSFSLEFKKRVHFFDSIPGSGGRRENSADFNFAP